MKDLDLLVLADRNSSVCRAYLSYLKAFGYKPKKILLVDHIGPSKIVNRISRVFGRQLTSHLLRLYRIIVSLRRNNAPEWMPLAKYMNAQFEHPVPFFDAFNYSDYAHEVETVVVKGFDDSRLLDAVINSRIKALLFTGGGLVKPELLSLPDTKIIHIHPGIVPDIKGADGILWSVLLRGKPGYSGFYMSPGIDTGDILIKIEYKLPCFDKHIYLETQTFDGMYKALLFSFDAHMRAKTLIALIEKSEDLNCVLEDMPKEAQIKESGRVYFFMHRVLRNAALETLCE